jgi:hypothetical protein
MYMFVTNKRVHVLMFGITKTGAAHPEQCKQSGRVDKNIRKHKQGQNKPNLTGDKEKDRDLQKLQRTQKGKKVAPVVRPRGNIIQEFEHGSTRCLEKCNSYFCVYCLLRFYVIVVLFLIIVFIVFNDPWWQQSSLEPSSLQ